MPQAAVIIDGKAIAAKVRAEVALAVKEIQARAGVTPGLALIRVGNDPASEVYVRGKVKACHETGMAGFEHLLPESTPAEDLLDRVRELNANPRVHGVLVQLPLPRHIPADEVLDALAPQKDVDGFGPHSAGALFTGRPGLRPCTPLGILRLLDESGARLQGARALVVGRSNIVGKPVAMMLLERHATVTLAHSRTADLAGEVAAADVLVAAVGKAEMIRGEWVKPGATVIDVGINRNPAGKLLGDVEFAPAARRARAITPVPGGVGPMTIAYLLSNTIQAAKAQLGIP
ncbi:MAG TPA: bifunctional methylenetetrahydrofolate dehydrogenase/methenyltetrahydrofolate cyclohydrolase FolD [Myxococcales bacterium]|nr:bifunctional methylenetetrahydrofolate dehydrogenase/methenyltetrahydrofolate cyclohydrolase FolD [Myxococcales bacterium]